MELEPLYAMRQTTGTAGANITCCSHNEQCGSAQITALQPRHLPDALNNEINGQGIAGGEDRTLSSGS
jgi:hypothetical protein